LLLLMVSGLLLRSLQRTLHANLGFDPDRILAVDLNLPAGEYEGRDSIANFYGPVLTRVGALPGVAGVGLTNMLPVRESGSNLLLAGVAAGSMLALAMQQTLKSVVDLHAKGSLPTLFGMGVVLTAAGLLASIPAARRASGTDPMQVLRAE